MSILLLPSIMESGKASCNYATIHVNDGRDITELVSLQTSAGKQLSVS